MHFANPNLLYQMHQSLGTQHVTTAFFKRYARSPETRSFKNYFRPSRSQSWIRPGHLFIPYLRKRPHYSLNRYITLHRRKKNPILQSFNQTKTTILTVLQQLQPVLSAGLIMQNKPNFKPTQNAITPYFLKPNASSLKSGAAKNKPNSNPSRSQFCNRRMRKADERSKAPCFFEAFCDNTDKFSDIKEQKKYAGI